MKEYTIVGDTKEHGTCLIYIVRGGEEYAKEVLHRILNNPTENDKHAIKGHSNIRINTVEGEDAWWNDPFLMSD